ncbi:MAG TPA: hypothetical protein VMX13_16635 [Sedimentisphaerales bacterium]|nr:hypothetical protein [Sedimentisphaerales bacterium]
MKLEERKPSGREKDEASVGLLAQLRENLYSDDDSSRRRAALNLSWMQEDGLDILKEAILSDFPKAIKKSAVYALRGMRGRMKKKVLELFRQGLKHQNSETASLCKDALAAVLAKTTEKPVSTKKKKKARAPGFNIREIPGKKKRKKRKAKTNGKRPFRPNRGVRNT